MKISNVLDVIHCSIRYYNNKDIGGKRFSLLEYYSFTDVCPKDLARIAYKKNRRDLSTALRVFDNKWFGASKKINIKSRLSNGHSIRGVELDALDKIRIYKKLAEEGYPLLDGVYERAAFYYMIYGIDSLSKENVRNRVFDSYFDKTSIFFVGDYEDHASKVAAKVLVK